MRTALCVLAAMSAWFLSTGIEASEPAFQIVVEQGPLPAARISSDAAAPAPLQRTVIPPGPLAPAPLPGGLANDASNQKPANRSAGSSTVEDAAADNTANKVEVEDAAADKTANKGLSQNVTQPPSVAAEPVGSGIGTKEEKDMGNPFFEEPADEPKPPRAPSTKSAKSPFFEETTDEPGPPDVVGEACAECSSAGPSCAAPCSQRACACRAGSSFSTAAGPFGVAFEPRRLFTPEAFRRRDITVGGWIDQGVSGVANRPADRYNGPVGFNDRDGEYQMNQLNVFLERKVDTGGCGLDVGGRIDFLYGTDARFVKCADGLDANWDRQRRFYQAALPQFCLDVGLNDWTVRMGHFYTILGYETAAAPDNFFYSHSYAKLYGEPMTHTGMLATRRLSDRLSLSGGFTRGWDQFDDTDGADRLGFLGGANWTSRDGRRSLAFAVTSGEQGPDNNTVMYSLTGAIQATQRLNYTMQYDYGQSRGNVHGPHVAEWYGINQYVRFDLNPKWAVGSRIEWFHDDAGTRVHGLGEGNLATGPYPGDFYEIALGLNWRPRTNVSLRPEVRWDWFHGPAGAGGLPFDAGDRDRQFLFACDLIVQF